MDNLEYLNQISARPAPAPKPSLLSSFNPKKLLTALGIFFAALILIIILGSLTSSDSSADLSRLKLRVENLSETISSTQPYLKSTSLRANAASLRSVLAGITTSLESSDLPDPSSSVEKEETELVETLNTTLTHARLNGYLDRVYARECVFELNRLISLLTSISATADPDTAKFLNSSADSIEVLLTPLETFSDAAK